MAEHSQSLSTNKPRETSFLTPTDNLTIQPTRLRPPLTFTPSAAPARIVLYMENVQRSIRLEVTSQLSIGRADFVEGHVPGLDLTPYGAQDAGVSRRHAMFFVADGNLYIRDLRSTNGTRINGLLLPPEQPYKLSEGDEIEFGHVRTRIDAISISRA